MPEAKGRPEQLTDGGGNLSRIAHFRELTWRRSQPGNCRRCGKPSPQRTCQRCLDYYATYRLTRKQRKALGTLDIEHTLYQFRRELTHLRATVKRMANRWRQAYRKGYYAGQSGRRARFRRGAWVPPSMSTQELATISHAYDHDHDQE